MSKKILRYFIYLLVIQFCGCTGKRESNTVFELVSSSETGITFNNAITIGTEINVIDFQYCYNGGGVGIGDFNQDNLPDIVFTGNQVSSKIYLNAGELRFKDVTVASQITTSSWVTGVSIVDINADGWDDIYFNVGGADCQNDCENLLFINQGIDANGIPVFTEEAKSYGLDDAGYSQQTVFFDYDRDGDLDAYIVRNGNVRFDKNTPIPERYYPGHLSDVLLENKAGEDSQLQFVNVSHKLAGAKKGFGLGIGINDFNNDGYVDIYVSNDFITNDLVYVNTRSKDSLQPLFQEYAKKFSGHQTYNAMGVDIADINNDQYPDVMVLDMFPKDYRRIKTMAGAMNYDKYQLALRNDYTPQYVRNTLQLHNGADSLAQIRFKDVSFLSQLSQTDWSWAPLLVDFDADGDKDIFVTNGYGADITNLDFINYTQQNNVFGTPESRDKRIKELVAGLEEVTLPNFFFENNRNLEFEDVSDRWASSINSISNGAAYSDLDLDGDLDLVVNNINQEAFILKNKMADKEDFHYLKIKLQGPAKNKNAIGAKVTVWSNSGVQTHFQSVIRGYLSSMDPTVFFGLQTNTIDSLEVLWPSGKRTIERTISSNQTLILNYGSAVEYERKTPTNTSLFAHNTQILSYQHKENNHNDYLEQQLLLTQYSKEGPCFAAGNSDARPGDELFIGGSAGNPGTLWSLDGNNVYGITQELDPENEDSDAVFFDYDGDGDLDLYIASGGNEFAVNDGKYRDRLYENKEGIFQLTTGKIPEITTVTNVVKPLDYDQDGDTDLFIGCGMVPKNYPNGSDSYVLKNTDGVFTKEGTLINGMVKDAIWVDVDNDQWQDLVVVGQWMPISVFKNKKGKLEPMETSFLNTEDNAIATNGWWRTIDAADFDQDGDMDFVLGNQGLNNFVNPSQEYPCLVYNSDYDGNGSIDPLVAVYYEIKGKKKLIPLHSRDDVMKQLVQLKDRFPSYENFANTDFPTLLNIENLEEQMLKVNVAASIFLENKGEGVFMLKNLLTAAQLAPVNDMLLEDFDQDGHLDVLMVGNDYHAEAHYGRYDAFDGLLLKGNGKGGFTEVNATKSGFFVPFQTNTLMGFSDGANNHFIFAGQNNKEAKVFQWNKTIQP